MKHSVGHSRNGKYVYVDLIRSAAAIHIAQQPQLLNLAEEALSAIALQDNEVRLEHDMKRMVGYDFVVVTSESDAVLYGQLAHDDVYTRFVKNGKPTLTQYVAMMLQRDGEGHYKLDDIWVGRISPPRPGSNNETDESKSYWASRAIVLNGQSIQSRTLTKDCPY